MHDDALNQRPDLLLHDGLVQRVHQVGIHRADIIEIEIDTDIEAVIDDIPVALDRFTEPDLAYAWYAAQPVRRRYQLLSVLFVTRLFQPQEHGVNHTPLSKFSICRWDDSTVKTMHKPCRSGSSREKREWRRNVMGPRAE